MIDANIIIVFFVKHVMLLGSQRDIIWEVTAMARTVAIGIQDFGDLIQKKCLYIDKTMFIKEWWDSNDSVTLISRPRRFGKTPNMSMLEQFFSVDYANGGALFEGLDIWRY